MNTWIPRNLRGDGMISMNDAPSYASFVQQYVLLSDHEQALAKIERQNVENLKLIDEEHEKDLAEKDAEIARWKARSWDENVRFLAEAKENLLKEYIHLTELYGAQKHEIRQLKADYQQLMEKAVMFAQWLRQHMDNEADEAQDADTFLQSPEVQAWKERKV